MGNLRRFWREIRKKKEQEYNTDSKTDDEEDRNIPVICQDPGRWFFHILKFTGQQDNRFGRCRFGIGRYRTFCVSQSLHYNATGYMPVSSGKLLPNKGRDER